MPNIPLVQVITASAIAGIIGVSGYFIGSDANQTEPVAVYIEPIDSAVTVNETFSVQLDVESRIPVNVFKGVLSFDHEKLNVVSIDYNTSIANLWAEEPWYSNGAGTINFTGGTTAIGGFVGHGTLLKITFAAKVVGDTNIHMSEMRVLQHDGFGTDVPLPNPIDLLFSIAPETLHMETLLESPIPGPIITVIPALPDTDLNDDGKQTIADVSIFMADLLTKNHRSDFNQDGSVDLKDLSILTKE